MSTAVAKREPDELSPQLDALKRVASQQTPKNEIRVRTGRGGMQLKYTDGAYVIRTLNAAFGWDWDFVADSEELLTNNGKPFEVKVRGTLTVRLNGQAVTKTQYGCQPIEFLKNGDAPVSIGDAYKGAATDAMKKCASLLGIALDLYDSDYKAEKYASEPTAMTSAGDAARQAFNKPAEPADAGEIVYEPSETGAIVYHAPEPVRNVKLAGAQWPKAPGLTGQIFAKCQALGWTAGQLADEVFRRFNYSMPDESVLTALADVLKSHQLKELDQALAAEFKNRGQ